MNACEHEGIVGLAAAFETQEEIMLVMELCVFISLSFLPLPLTVGPIPMIKRRLPLGVLVTLHIARPYLQARDSMVGGDLFDLLIEKKRFSEDEARVITKKVVSALQYLHSNGIVHRGTEWQIWVRWSA